MHLYFLGPSPHRPPHSHLLIRFILHHRRCQPCLWTRMRLPLRPLPFLDPLRTKLRLHEQKQWMKNHDQYVTDSHRLMFPLIFLFLWRKQHQQPQHHELITSLFLHCCLFHSASFLSVIADLSSFSRNKTDFAGRFCVAAASSAIFDCWFDWLPHLCHESPFLIHFFLAVPVHPLLFANLVPFFFSSLLFWTATMLSLFY